MFKKKKKPKNDHPTHWTLGFSCDLELGFDDGTYLPRKAGILFYPQYFDENGEPIKSALPIGKEQAMKNKNLVKLKACPIGLFIKDNTLCVKTEYGNEAYIVYSGEYFWGGAKTKEEIGEVLVLPISDKVVQRLERKYGRKMKGADNEQREAD